MLLYNGHEVLKRNEQQWRLDVVEEEIAGCIAAVAERIRADVCWVDLRNNCVDVSTQLNLLENERAATVRSLT